MEPCTEARISEKEGIGQLGNIGPAGVSERCSCAPSYTQTQSSSPQLSTTQGKSMLPVRRWNRGTAFILKET